MNNKKQQKQPDWLTLSHVDLFGVQPKFYINNKERYKTSWGGSLTIILISCVIVACWVYGKDMYYREHPTTTISEIPTSMPEKFQINRNSFNFSFGLQGSDKKSYFDESIYYVKFYQFMVNKVKDEEGNMQNEFIWRDLEARRCTEKDFQVDREYFVTNQANFNSYCLNNDLEDMYIEGIWGAERVAMIQGRVYPCVEGTDSKVECKPEQEVYDTLTDNQFSLSYTDQVINPLNYEEPFQSVGRNAYGLASWDSYRVNNYYFKNVYVEDNVGIIFDSIEQKKGIQYTYDKEFVQLGQHKDKKFIEFNLRFQSVKETKISRKYLNLAQVLANVGGILKVLMIGFATISWLVSKQLFDLQLANQIFNFKINENGNLEQSQNQDQKNKNQNRRDTTQKEDNYLIQFKSYLGLLFPFCASRKTKANKEFLNFAVNKLTQRLNLNYMLEKFVEIEKIKLLLLDNDQHKLFDYISKPTIDQEIIDNYKDFQKKKTLNLNKDEDLESQHNQKQTGADLFQNILLMENTNQKVKRRNCIKAYKNIRSKNKKSLMDFKMLDFIDEKVLLKDQRDIIEKQILEIQNTSKQQIEKDQTAEEQYQNGNYKQQSYIQKDQIVEQNQKQLQDQIEFQNPNLSIRNSIDQSRCNLKSKEKLNNSNKSSPDIFIELQELQLDDQYIDSSKISELPDSYIRNSQSSKQFQNSFSINPDNKRKI